YTHEVHCRHMAIIKIMEIILFIMAFLRKKSKMRHYPYGGNNTASWLITVLCIPDRSEKYYHLFSQRHNHNPRQVLFQGRMRFR
ncbi:MAG: hypothetical protein IJV76_11530, partial [Clostridia bacterium]|nr:hypothetical protein [Clostridia bacterium]